MPLYYNLFRWYECRTGTLDSGLDWPSPTRYHSTNLLIKCRNMRFQIEPIVAKWGVVFVGLWLFLVLMSSVLGEPSLVWPTVATIIFATLILGFLGFAKKSRYKLAEGGGWDGLWLIVSALLVGLLVGFVFFGIPRLLETIR